MTRQKRCLAAIAGKTVDRTPTYVCAISCEVSSKILGRPAHTGTGSLHYAEVLANARGQDAHAEFEERFARDILDIHRALDIDVFRMPWRATGKPAAQIGEYTFLFGDPDGNHSIARYDPETTDYSTVKTVVKYPERIPSLRERVEAAEAQLAEGRDTPARVSEAHLRIHRDLGGEFFVVFNGGGISAGLSETELMNLVLEPELKRRELMVRAENAAKLGTALAESGCPKVMLGGGDMAGNDGPVYSPKAFRGVVLPAYQRLMDGLRPLDVHYVFRSDGDLWPVADMLFREAGCPGFGEVDRDAGMTIASLRERYPGLVIWGNMSSSLLAHGSAQKVREEARRVVGESSGTGYFHGCSNAIVKGTPIENVEAMFSIR